MGNSMCRKHHSVFRYHYKYMHNGIMKPFRVGILQYTKHVRNIHDLAKFLPKILKKGDEYDQAYYTIHDKELSG